MIFRMMGLLLVLLTSIAPARVAVAQANEAKAEAAATDDAAEPAAEAKQGYEQLPVDEAQKRNVNAISSMLMSGKFNGQQQPFDDFYQKYLLARWTDPKNLTTLPSLRKELRTSHLGRKSAGTEVHEHLNSLVLEFMKKLISGGYHPAVQVNAMLMIGELNEVEAPPTTIPLPAALEAMIEVVGDSKMPNAVRAAAMVGIQRHVVAKIGNQDAQRTLTTAMLKVAAEDVPEDGSRGVREWILGQALETLAGLGSVGENGAAFKAMEKTVADAKLSLSTRAIAAESLGRLNYASATGINPMAAASSLGQFIVDACAKELPKAKDGGKTVSRRMLQCLNAATVALVGGDDASHKGIASLAKEAAQQARLAELKKIFDKATEPIAKWADGDDLESPVDALQGSVEEWLKKK